MALPEWMENYPGAPQPMEPDADEPVGIKTHRACGGEGCGACDDTGVVYP
ncbi:MULTISPECIES: hypothetical protein [Streptomyces]|nr:MULTISPECIES: hypothetical protein [Streptomyces]NDZ98530.1 hypothetical protein [Streptomyces sp. SID10116]MYY79744.1 hypothetical protein [Streptomyces sp. SID335]MYZ16552.1 hypothetical protein [Streptomyces sp. SID337]NDZ84519.1 hypothetical protein [Streptomyces sp. SID10115]NEB43482.1 hypothetical protein [Streptomyces sp. SID339]